MKKYLGKDHYWWFCANPFICNVSKWEDGTNQPHTWYNDLGHKRRVFPNFISAKIGDITVFYESSPTKAVVALAKIVDIEPHKTITFQKIKSISPIPFSKLKEIEELSKMEFLNTPNGSFFKLLPSEYEVLCNIVE